MNLQIERGLVVAWLLSRLLNARDCGRSMR